MSLISIKVKKNLGDIWAGSVIRVEADKNGLPLDRYWRDRLKDSAIDDCCEILEKEANHKPIVKKRPKPKKEPESFKKK